MWGTVCNTDVHMCASFSHFLFSPISSPHCTPVSSSLSHQIWDTELSWAKHLVQTHTKKEGMDISSKERDGYMQQICHFLVGCFISHLPCYYLREGREWCLISPLINCCDLISV